MVKARNKGEAKEAGRHVREFRDMKRRENFKTKVGFRHNSQKHFRDPLLQVCFLQLYFVVQVADIFLSSELYALGCILPSACTSTRLYPFRVFVVLFSVSVAIFDVLNVVPSRLPAPERVAQRSSPTS